MTESVNFELAKLLKEKGFNLKVINFYNYDKLSTPFDKDRQVDGLINYNPINWNGTKNHYTSAPTIAEVIMWLYEKHGIWIAVDWMRRVKPYNSKFYCHLRGINKDLNSDNFISINDTLKAGYKVFNSPTEAYESAIEYVLNNLI